MADDYVYPVTIIRDRYSGTYSGALWTAFNSYDVPEGPNGCDLECSEFWDHPDMPVGKGRTPDEALADLTRAVQQWREMKGDTTDG